MFFLYGLDHLLGLYYDSYVCVFDIIILGGIFGFFGDVMGIFLGDIWRLVGFFWLVFCS